MSTISVSETVAVTTAIVAVLALIYQIRIAKRQTQIQTFLIYTDRYRDVLRRLPPDIMSPHFNLDDLVEARKEDTRRAILDYFDLCSEEFYLWSHSLVGKEVWRLWSEGMKSQISKDAFRSEWGTAKQQRSYDSKFVDYMESLLHSGKAGGDDLVS